jgi:ABC-type Zn uptake system ZnuABC Zn-binding protein ZnuA
MTPSLAPRLSLTLRLLLVAVLSGLLLGACGPGTGGSASPGGDAGASPAGALEIVATTTVFADIVRNVGGDRVTVDSIIPAGAGPEDYEPKPADAQKLTDADLIVSNGVGLDGFLDKLIDAAGEGSVPRLVLGDGIPPIEVDGEPNPHFWLDPTLVSARYVPAIAAKLTALDAAGTATYAANAAAYTKKLEALDAANKTKIETIPSANRKLVTFHDAFPYFAREYGIAIVGVAVEAPGQDPSAAYTAKLIDAIKAAGVRAIFSEDQFPTKLVDQLAAETGAKVVANLYDDSVGDPPIDSYEAIMSWDVDQLVGALR